MIDAHVHVWDVPKTAQPWIPPEAEAALRRDFTLADLRAAASGAGVRSVDPGPIGQQRQPARPPS